MAQATEKQVKDLEKALTEQFFLLVQAATFRLNLARKYGLKDKAFLDYSKKFEQLVRAWVLKEVPYEKVLLQNGIKGLIASGNVHWEDFFDSAKLPLLYAVVKKFDKQGEGLGFPIPLLIWAVIAIVGAFTAAKITDDLTTTTQEKQELMQTTQQTCKDLGLTTEQCAEMISQTQKEASAGGGFMDMIFKVGFPLLLGYGIYKVATSTPNK